MKNLNGPRRRRSQAGVALLIAIFVLMLISVTAIALIISSGTETALAGNYRSSASTYYAALAGIEEARGRLLPSNPDYLGAFVAPPGTQLPLGQVRYVTNPVAAENVLAAYPDTQYDTEFGLGALAAATGAGNVKTIPSVSTVTSGGTTYQGPPFKWVRINAVTEQSLNLDVDGDGAANDNGIPLYFDPAHIDTATGKPKPSLIVSAVPPPSAVQALEITALAALPNGSQKLLKYIVAPSTLSLNFTGSSSSNVSFPSALTLVGNNVNFDGPSSTSFNINGNDQFSVGACAPGTSAVSAIGYTNGADSSLSNILAGNVTANKSHYFGAGTMTPNVSNVTGLPPNFQTPSGLDALVQTITQGADAVISGPVTQTDTHNVFPAGMSPSNPMTIVVNGDLSISAWHNTGYGLLLVTGTLTFDPDASWKGIILVVGQGQFISTLGGTGQIDGAVLVAKTRDAAGKLLPDPNLGVASFKQTGGGLGIYYSTCWLNAAAGPQRPMKYQVLSYHQISQ
ncbi:MAG TPA: hypothetical protein VHF01_14840 [Candidatus Acidoferrum sp.]|nr:hypothetical protein [Candidatus Acidoferrum sp.]